MVTLLDYTTAHFPNHTVVELKDPATPRPASAAGGNDSYRARVLNTPDSEPNRDKLYRGETDLLSEHTVIAHVVGEDDGVQMLHQMLAAHEPQRPVALMVRPAEASIVPADPEDSEGIVDLPNKRIGASSLLGGVGVGLAATVLIAVVNGSLAVALIAGTFAAILGGVIFGMLGGGGRHAGERAWSQPQAPGRNIVVVAAFADTESDATRVARLMEAMQPYEIRVVNSHGEWHTPNT